MIHNLDKVISKVEACLTIEELQAKLSSNKKLVVKWGIDPTLDRLHLGHYISVRKLRELGLLGHKIVVILGSFTAGIGDLSGNSGRRIPPFKEIYTNADNIATQIRGLLASIDLIVYNNNYLANSKLKDLSVILNAINISSVLDTSKFGEGESVSLMRALYPILQGLDSVDCEADIEIGGTDQRSNIIIARKVQKIIGQNPEVGLLLPILTGIDGKNKMSKSLNNCIYLDDSPKDMFGKVMSIPDSLVPEYFRLILNTADEHIETMSNMVRQATTSPRTLKEHLATEVVANFYSVNEAVIQAEDFRDQFSRKLNPSDVRHVTRPINGVKLYKLLKSEGLAESISDAKRLIEAGAVAVNGDKVSNVLLMVGDAKGDITIRVGKLKFLNVEFV